MDWVLQTYGLSKRYGRSMALNNVGLEIRRGQIYGLMGLNGAGKTTFMRVVAGVIAPTAGEVALFGESSPAGLGRQRRRVGQLIESPSLYPGLTAAENLEIQRRLAGVPDRNAVGRMLELVGLTGAGAKKTKHFSLGMKQRLGIGLALITDPEFVILDEPVNGLDPRGIVEIRDLVRTLAHDLGVTLLISSHLLDELAQVATHYGILDHGRLVKQLSAAELEAQSRRFLRLVARPQETAVTILGEEWGVRDFRVVSPTEIHLYERIDEAGKLNNLLTSHGVEVDAIGTGKQNLEDYFMNLMGDR